MSEYICKEELIKRLEQRFCEGCAKTLILICYCLHNSFSFGEKRLKKIVDEVKYLDDCMKKDLVNMQDLHEVLKDECNFDVYNGIV